jgi:hypothetical protein
MDEDLASMSREQLIEEVRKLRRGIRAHRDSTGHELCWRHPALWGLFQLTRDLRGRWTGGQKKTSSPVLW